MDMKDVLFCKRNVEGAYVSYRIGMEAAYRELLKYDIHKVNREENVWKA